MGQSPLLDLAMADWLTAERRAGTPGCANPDCGDYPFYGVAPHECFYKRGAEFGIGQSIGLPPSKWPANFVPDLEPGETAETVIYPNACGTYHCPTCLGGESASLAAAPEEPSPLLTAEEGPGCKPPTSS